MDVQPVLQSVVVMCQLLGVDTFGCIHWIYFQHTLAEHLALQRVLVCAVNFLHAYTMFVQLHGVFWCGVFLVSRPYFLSWVPLYVKSARLDLICYLEKLISIDRDCCF